MLYTCSGLTLIFQCANRVALLCILVALSYQVKANSGIANVLHEREHV